MWKGRVSEYEESTQKRMCKDDEKEIRGCLFMTENESVLNRLDE
jgi:hypothetical protein